MTACGPERADNTYTRVAHKVAPGSSVLRAWELIGGISAQVTALEIERPDGTRSKLVIRRHGAVDRSYNPHIAADEYRLLRLLHARGLAVPAPYALDESGDLFATPYLVVAYIEGKPDFAPASLDAYLRQLATQLASIHTLTCSDVDVTFLPEQTALFARRLTERTLADDDALGVGQLREIVCPLTTLPQRNPAVLLHGDFWPGNVLWRDGRIVAVVDWEDAARGDPLADLANTRLEILLAFGDDAMRRFTQRYHSLTSGDFTDLPAWDLAVAWRAAATLAMWAGDAAERRLRERHRWFIEQARAALSAC